MVTILEPVLLSICIPTRGRIDILQNTLNSIFNSIVYLDEFEVVIYDSGDSADLEDLIKKSYNYPNIFYKRGENFGFLNLVEALKMGKGSFLKLHNDYSLFLDGSLRNLLGQVRSNLEKKGLLFFANSAFKVEQEREKPSFDEFMRSISFYSSWSTCFGIWSEDFEKVKDRPLHPMFPHTSLLFSLFDKESYVVIDDLLFLNKSVGSKGGYDLFRTFAVDYLNMVKTLNDKRHITYSTFEKIKRDLLIDFLSTWYCNTKLLPNKFTFDLNSIKKSVKQHYKISDFWLMVALAYFKAGGKIMSKIRTSVGKGLKQRLSFN